MLSRADQERNEKMTKKEYVERNIGVTFDFVKHVVDHPEHIDTIPDGAELDFTSTSHIMRRSCLRKNYNEIC